MTRKQSERDNDIQTNHDISKIERDKNTKGTPSEIVEKVVEKEEINYDILEKEKSKSRNDALSVIAEKEVEKEEFSQEMTKGKKNKKIRKQSDRWSPKIENKSLKTGNKDWNINENYWEREEMEILRDIALDCSTPMCDELGDEHHSPPEYSPKELDIQVKNQQEEGVETLNKNQKKNRNRMIRIMNARKRVEIKTGM